MFAHHWVPPSHCTGTLRWEPGRNGMVPPDAAHGGSDVDGSTIYIGRTFHEGDLLPAKICPRHGCAYVSWNGMELRKYDYEVLCSRHLAWKEAHGGSVPPEAIRVGHTASGEPLYCGRVLHHGALSIGKVHPSHGVVYLPFNGAEISYPSYEVLVLC